MSEPRTRALGDALAAMRLPTVASHAARASSSGEIVSLFLILARILPARSIGAELNSNIQWHHREVIFYFRRWICGLAALFLLIPAQAAPPAAQKTKLVVAIIIDQFRYDYMTRFDASYQDGLRRLRDAGAFFTDAHQAHYPTVTAVGHAAFLTGSIPAINGIIGNEWLDRETGKMVTSVSDDA